MVLAVAGCSPRGPEALRRGDAALTAGKVDEAIPLLERAVADLPGNAAAWNQLGLAYQAAGRSTEAQKAYLHALNDDRNFFDAHFNLGALEFEQRNWREAERELRTYLAVEANRTNGVAWQLLGDALLGSGQFEPAERALSVALQASPGDPSILNSLGLTLSARRRTKEAQTRFVQAVRIDSKDPASRLNLAIVTQQLGDRKGALDHYRAYLALNPTGPEVSGVQELVKQLEAAFAVPPAVATNRVPTTNVLQGVVTKPAARVVTNAVAATPTGPARPTNAPPPVAKAPAPAPPTNLVARTSAPPVDTTPKPSTTAGGSAPAPSPAAPSATAPAPQPRPELPVEIVRVDDGPELKPARDVASARPSPPAPAPTANPASSPTPPAPTVAKGGSPKGEGTPAAAAKEDRDDSAKDAGKKTFWQKVSPVNWGNPVKWFRGSEADTNATTTLAKTTEKPVTRSPATNRVATPPASATQVPAVSAPPPSAPAPPAKPVVPRYVRRSVPVVSPGNRSAAEASARQAEASLDNEAALVGWQRAVQQDPSWSAAWMELGRLALDTSKPALALQAGEALTTLDPSAASSHQLFAAALARAGYPRDAADELEKAVAIAPGNAGVHLALAGIYARDLAEPALARPHYEQVLALDPKHPQAAAIRVWLASNPG